MRNYTLIVATLAVLAARCGDDPVPTAAAAKASAADASSDAALAAKADAVAEVVTDAVQHDAAPEAAAETQPQDAAPLPAIATDTIGGVRPAKVTVPDTWAKQPKWALIILLHGFSATGGQQDWYFGLSGRATSHGFVAVVPEGTKDKVGAQFWNATKACCNFADIAVDDVAYIGGLIDEAVAKLRVDPQRVYVLGHSNGAFMALRLACEISGKITAIGSLAGAVDIDPSKCKNALPVSVLHIHGTLDNVIPFNGGANLGNAFPSAKTTVANWVANNGCPAQETKLADINFEDILPGNETNRTQWAPCKQGTDVTFWQVNGALHIPIFNSAFKDAVVEHLLARTRVAGP